MRLIYVLLCLLTFDAAHAQNAAIFNGDAVKILKEKLRFKTEKDIISGTIDPTAVATPGDTGSMFLRDNGVAYIKQDDGTTTNWFPLLVGPPVTAAFADYILVADPSIPAGAWQKKNIKKNGLSNSGFENGVIDWVTAGSCTIDTTAQIPLYNSQAHIDCGSSQNGTLTQDTTALTDLSGRLAKFTCKLDVSGSFLDFTMRTRANGSTSKSRQFFIGTAPDRQEVTIIDTIDGTSNGIQLELDNIVLQNSDAYIDDCYIEPLLDLDYELASAGSILTKDEDGESVWSTTISGTLNPVSNWESFTPSISNVTSTGANAEISGKVRTNGDTAEIQLFVNTGSTGSGSAGVVELTLPNSWIIDNTKIARTGFSGRYQINKTGTWYDSSAGPVYKTIYAYAESSTTISFAVEGTAAQLNGSNLGSNDQINITFDIPVVSLSSGTGAAVQNVALLSGRYKKSAAGGVSSGVVTVLDIDEKVHGNLDAHMASGVFTSPKDACYIVSAGAFSSLLLPSN